MIRLGGCACRPITDHPSLAEVLPSGVICVDDISGTAPGLLNTPAGFDLLAPDGATPTHPWTG
jgi:hypothetical protein